MPLRVRTGNWPRAALCSGLLKRHPAEHDCSGLYAVVKALKLVMVLHALAERAGAPLQSAPCAKQA